MPLLNALKQEEKDILCCAWIEPLPDLDSWAEKRFILKIQISSDMPSLIRLRGSLKFKQADMAAGFLDEDTRSWEIKSTEINLKKLRKSGTIDKHLYIRPKKSFPVPRIAGTISVLRVSNPALIYSAELNIAVEADRK